jgi:tetratricopeptide (TPR) repeat protein
MRSRISFMVLGLLVSACAAPPKTNSTAHSAPPSQPAPAPAPRAAAPAAATSDARADLMFHVLSAELAAKQGNAEQAMRSYLAAARLSTDPQLAERAARLALYLGDRAAAQEGAERWRQLAPTASEPHEVLGMLELRGGDQVAALAHFEQALRMYATGLGDGFARLALLLGEEEDKSRALGVLQALAERYPDEPHAHQSAAEMALQAKQPSVALAAAERAQALDPAWTAPALVKVRAWLQAGEGDKAVRLLEDTLKRRPNDYDLRLQYARTLLTLERNENALQQFERLLKARPQDAQVMYVAALIALELGEAAKARDYLLRLVNAGQRVNEAYYYLGRLAQNEGDVKGALRWYTQVQGEQRPEAMMRAAVLQAALGELESARKRLAEMRRDYPELAVRSYAVEAQLLQDKGELEQAYDLYTDVLARQPDEWELRYGRALMAVQLDRLTEAEQDLRLLLDQRPDSAQALNALGYTLVDRTDRHQEGFELIERAYKLRPDDAAIVDSLGWAHYRLGRAAEARDYLEQAYALNPESEIAAHLVEVLWRLNERKAAARILQDALKREPDNSLLLETKQRLK